jgi:pimeloyl-ACP methyl ester carboxylesterase|tara:strand:+ start:226 stop:1149 length:924 start_codon:yes stop_codon:yes gene_type:complete
LKKVLFLFFIFIIIPASLYLNLNRENIDISEFRLNSGYEEVKLSDGITSYKDIGDKNNKVIILVHGATFGSLAYEEYVNVFVENNYRVITYDQYGRGYSDRIHSNVSIELMEKQLKELIEHCEVEDVILYGISFGASVVAKYASNNPDNISFIGYQVPLINSANIPLLAILKIPLYGDLLIRGFLVPSVLKRIEEYEDLMSKELLDHYIKQFEVKGTENFFKKFFLGSAMSNRLKDHTIIGNNSISSYFAYAEDDTEIDSKLVEAAIKKYKNSIVKKYSGGHFFSAGIEREVAQEFVDSIKEGLKHY